MRLDRRVRSTRGPRPSLTRESGKEWLTRRREWCASYAVIGLAPGSARMSYIATLRLVAAVIRGQIVAEEPLLMSPDEVPHHGPVGPACPVDRLRTALSLMTLHPLARAYDAPFDPPRTVGDVVEMHAGGRLNEIQGLGKRRISEIEAALVLAGVDIIGDPPRPRSTTGQQANGRAAVTDRGVADRFSPSAGIPGVNPSRGV